MMCRYVRSQRGFSLIKILLSLIIAVAVVLYFLPYLSGGNSFSVVNELSAKARGIGSVLTSRVQLLTAKMSNSLEGTTTKISRKLEALLDKLNFKKLATQIAEVREEWETDMTTLIEASKSRGFDMGQVQQSFDEYNAEERSWKRVESLYWSDLRSQTQQEIEKSFQHFLTQPVGCSDYTVEFKTILSIGNYFNEDTFEGYSKAKELSGDLYNPRSLSFVKDLFEWFRIAGIYTPAGDWKDDWFIQKLTQAIDTSQNSSPDYPGIIHGIEQQAGSHQVYRILGDIVVAEIYLNYDLVNSTLEYYDEAIRNLYALANTYDRRNPYSYTTLGMHMALGLMNERMCSNNDLAMKEFKDVIAIANRLGLSCEQYNDAHYHLAVMNLQIRERAAILPKFTTVASSRTDTVEALLPPAPTKVPDVTSTGSGVVTGTVGDENSRRTIPIPTPVPLGSEGTARGVVKQGRGERPATGTTAIEPVLPATPTPVPIPPSYGEGEIQKGTVDVLNRRPERDIRLVPRQELGDSVRMNFTLDQLYDLSKIPDDAAREFEWYLKCQKQGDEVDVARYVLNKYLGK